MKLRTSSRFVKKASQLTKKNPSLKEKLEDTLLLLSRDITHPSLKTHKLKGKFSGLWSASWGYDLRIIFEISDDDNEKVIDLISIGSHDEVY
ncbi:MAG: type II toxin-antitoxin system mRNA interferase toxin, RelE/StbE family [Ignavibacteria bacterium]|nr:type II toxin-antitoxin system mRNA interferase toxin, RelE/StbE family [Ignavibacteria bacterium]